MKSPFCLVALPFVVLAPCVANGQGTMLVRHSGAADPTTEGFTLAAMGSQASVGPVTSDGISAWNTTVSNVNNNTSYTYSLTPQQQAATIGSDWILSFTLQDLVPGPVGNSFVTVGGAFIIGIGSEESGDPYIGFRSNPIFILDGGGPGYHNYQVVYDALGQGASIWVDGTERVPDYLHNLSIPEGITAIQWGESQGGPSSANWNLVSFQVVPEPSVSSLICLGGLFILGFVCRRFPERGRERVNSYD